jgi:transcription factor SPN1
VKKLLLETHNIMSSDDEDDLFGDDSDDTADLIASSKKKVTTKKNENSSKTSTAPVKGADDSDDDSDGGLFDSDSDDDDKKSSKKKSTLNDLSKRQRLELLARKKGSVSMKSNESKRPAKPKTTKTSEGGTKNKADGYDSEDSYESATFERTEEDDNFIDTTGEDADAVNELYSEQYFGDDRPDRSYNKKNKSKKRRHNDDEAIEDNGNLEPDNPIMAAVHRMKKKKREKKNLSEVEEEAKHFLHQMELAADEDETAIAERRPATKKLSMLNEVCDMLKRRDMQRLLLDFQLLKVCKRWIQPLPNGTLGNITIRQRLLDTISKMTGETGISPNDLKQSDFGKVVMILYKHRSETPSMKRLLKELIEQWSRPIFNKSGNMRDLERVHESRGMDGLAALARQQQFLSHQQSQEKQIAESTASMQDINSLIESGKKGGPESGSNRVRVPFSKGFAFSVRPQSRASASPEKRSVQPGLVKDNRSNLTKRMIEKSRTVGKNQRSANVSVEGRVTKG